MITLIVNLQEGPNGTVQVGVTTNAFDPRKEPAHVGAFWVGICNALNAHMRERGLTSFDCLKMRGGPNEA